MRTYFQGILEAKFGVRPPLTPQRKVNVLYVSRESGEYMIRCIQNQDEFIGMGDVGTGEVINYMFL